ncbi:MAG: tetratricopeptide repeat protein [Caldilineaceae bacterium]
MQGQYSVAKELAEECKSMLEHLGYAVGLAYLYSNLGHISRAEQQWLAAADYYEKSLDISYAVNLRDTIEACHYGLGCTLLEQNKLDEAYQQFMQSLTFAESRGTQNHRGAAAVYNALAAVAILRQEFADAKNNLHVALDIALRNDALSLIVDILLNLSQLAKAQNQLRTAFILLCFIETSPHAKYSSKQSAAMLLAQWSNESARHRSLSTECYSDVKDLTINEILELYIPVSANR